MFFGVTFTGKGKVWVDELRITIESKDISLAKAKPLSALDKDKEFDISSGIEFSNTSSAQYKDLATLGKIWGYLKYYHPNVVSGKYNWDYELFRIIPKTLKAANLEERNAILTAWIKGLGTVAINNDKPKANALLKSSADLTWINNQDLGQPLTEILKQLINAKRDQNGFYVKPYSDDESLPAFRNEPAHIKNGFPDGGYRLLALFRFWNIIEYYFPYKYAIGKNWDDILAAYIPKVVNAHNELAYKLCMAQLVAEIHDSHANLSSGFDPIINKYFGLYKPAVQIKFVDSKAVVIANFGKNPTGENVLRPGDVITEINELSVSKVIQDQLPYTSASNYPTQLRKMTSTLIRTNDSTIKIVYLRGKKKDSVLMQTFPYHRTSYLDPRLSAASFKVLKNNIAYINPQNLRARDVPAIMDSAVHSQAIIIDMRSYPKETSVTTLIAKYLFQKTTDFISFSKSSIMQPGQFEYLPYSYMKNLAIGETRKDAFMGKLFILIDETTQSFAEMSAMAFRARANSYLVGSQTAGADGTQMPDIQLPGGITFSFTALGVYYPDGRETQRIGIVPDIEVKPTVEGIADGKDEILERAIIESLK